MNENLFAYLLAAICSVALAVGQILFKFVGRELESGVPLQQNVTVLTYMSAAVLVYAVSTILWVISLKTLPLSKAYPFMAVGFVLIPVASHYIFGDSLSSKQILGLLLVVAGVIIATAS